MATVVTGVPARNRSGDSLAVQALHWMNAHEPDFASGWTTTEVKKGLGLRWDGALYNALRSMCDQPFGPFAPGTGPVIMTPGSSRRFLPRDHAGHYQPAASSAPEPVLLTATDVLWAFASTAGPKSAQALAGTLGVSERDLVPLLQHLAGRGLLRINEYRDRIFFAFPPVRNPEDWRGVLIPPQVLQ